MSNTKGKKAIPDPHNACCLEVVSDPFAWMCANLPMGQRLIAGMVDFDTNRPDVRINLHNVVLFRDSWTATNLLQKEGFHIVEKEELKSITNMLLAERRNAMLAQTEQECEHITVPGM